MKVSGKKTGGMELILGTGTIGTGKHGKRLHFTYIHDKTVSDFLGSAKMLLALVCCLGAFFLSAVNVMDCIKRWLIALPGRILHKR